MSESRRVLKVEKEVKEIVARFLSRDFLRTFPILLTVSRVQLGSDLRQGKVFVSLMGTEEVDEELQQDVLEALEQKAPEVQMEINRKLRMKFCPKLKFVIDRSMDKVLYIENTLHQLRKKDGAS